MWEGIGMVVGLKGDVVGAACFASVAFRGQRWRRGGVCGGVQIVDSLILCDMSGCLPCMREQSITAMRPIAYHVSPVGGMCCGR